MSDNDASPGSTDLGGTPKPPLPPFPWKRFLYCVGFAIAAWCAFWIVLLTAVLQFLLVLLQSLTGSVSGHPSDDLKRFSLRMMQYLLELLAYISFVRDTRPFPFGPFPKL